MRAVCVRQPWASMIADGSKSIEVRSWCTGYRGQLIVCASRRPADQGPAGVTIALVDLVDVRPLRPEDRLRSGGVYVPGHYAWVLARPVAVECLPVTGRLGLFRLPSETEVALRAAANPA